MQENLLCIFVLFSETWFSCLDDDLSIFVQPHIVAIGGFAFNKLSSIHVYFVLVRLSQLFVNIRRCHTLLNFNTLLNGISGLSEL